jgi:hypothetical protein
VWGNLQMTTIMQAASPKCLHNFGLWIISYNAMHDLWDTRLNGVSSSFKDFMPFGYWYSITVLIWSQIHKFWDGIHLQGASSTNSWGLPFPFLLTHILKKKGIKGTSTNGPIKKHPHFGRIQWNQSHVFIEHQQLWQNGWKKNLYMWMNLQLSRLRRRLSP